jgi:ABC-2 type transport system permease protein
MEKKEKAKKVKAEKPEKKGKSFKETVTLMFRKKWLTSTTQTALLVAILIAIFIAINLFAQSKDLPEIDVTENKIYTLSDASKEAIGKISQDVKIYIYGYEDGDTIVSFVKQYAKANDHITYEILTEENNLAKVQEFELESGYQIIILETEDSSKIIDTSYEFYSYDYTTGQEVDLTEQCLTNSLLAITAESKPKVYFTTGHNEYSLDSELGVLSTYLGNESYDASSVNLLTTGAVPEDCNLLVIMAPVKDFLESEVDAVLAYINKGGNLIITSDVGNIDESYPNLTKIYDVYGVTMENKGYIYETDTSKTANSYPNIFMPDVSSSNNITSDIYSDGGQIWLVYAGRITFKSDEELTALNVTKEELLASSEDSLFITDLTQSAAVAANSAEKGKSTIAALVTKTITPATEATDDTEATDAVESQLMIMANSSFITDYKVEQLSSQYPVSYLGNNKDFMLNAISELTSREDTLKIRKDMSTSTYQPTDEQHLIVLLIIFSVPVAIILLGIIVWNVRRRKR